MSRSTEGAGGTGPARQPRERRLRTALACAQVHIWRGGGIPGVGPFRITATGASPSSVKGEQKCLPALSLSSSQEETNE